MPHRQYGTSTAFDITLASLPKSSASANISAQVANGTGARDVEVFYRIKTGSAPTAGGLYKIYWVRDDQDSDAIRSDSYGTAKASAVTIPVNTRMVGTIVVDGNANSVHEGSFIVQECGPKFSALIENATDQDSNATESTHALRYRFIK